MIPERFSRVLEKLALRQSGDATLTVVNIAFRDAGSLQQRSYRDFVLAKDGDRLPSGEPRRAWQNYPACFLGHVQRSECESCAD